MPTLTHEQKAEKQKRDNLQRLCNRIQTAFSFKQIKNWGDVYKFTTIPTNGFTPDNLDDHLRKDVTIGELRNYFKTLENQLNQTIARDVTIRSQQPINPSRSVSLPTTVVTPIVPQPSQSISQLDKEATAIVQETIDKYTEKNNYGLIKSEREKAFLYWFQKKATAEALNMILNLHLKSLLIIAGTGTGKTFICAALIRRLLDSNYHVGKTFGLVNYLYVTKATVVEQAKRIFSDHFNIRIIDGVEILNIEQLRARAGKMWVTEKSKIVENEEVFYWEWKRGITPTVVIWDECQGLNNHTSEQHKIAAALNDIPGVVQVFVSASPFARVSGAKCFAVSTHKSIEHITGISGTVLSNETWSTYANSFGADQMEYDEGAVERMMADLEKYIIRVKGVRPQFDAINKIKIIQFETAEQRADYAKAWADYQQELQKKNQLRKALGQEEKDTNDLVAFLKFRMKAEILRAPWLAREMFRSWKEDGVAPVAALNFKGTMIEIVKLLVDKYGVSRSMISLVWGGGQTDLTDRQKAKAKILSKADDLKAAGIDVNDMLVSLELDKIEDRVMQELPEHLRLGIQSKDERQKEIDRFQSGRSQFCLFTFKAGGVGLSLHHTDEQTTRWDESAVDFENWHKRICLLPEKQRPAKGKVRHKESGYAVEEDIPYIPIRRRRCFLAPTYSAIEMVQGLGRCPRLTSLSNTEQFLIFFGGTIEEDVAEIVSVKLRCLSRVVRQREKWTDIVIGGVPKSAHLGDNMNKPDNEDDGEIGDIEDEN